MTLRTLTNDKGVALIAAVATLLILAMMGTTVVSIVGTESYSVIHQGQSLEAYWLAEAGIHRALTYISREDGSCTAITGGSAFTNVALGGGKFTVTATRYYPSPTGLFADVTNIATTIPVDDTTGFAPYGRIAIESEYIGYTGTTPTSFTGAKRGMDGTTAAAHSAGASVAQFQCTIVSTGVVSAGFGDAKRVVEAVVQ